MSDLPETRHLDTSNSTSSKLSVENPEHIVYHHGLLEIAILGGIRTDILDRMRVTLKIKVEHLSLRHNLDLYNSTQVDKLVRLVAERLELGTSVIAAALMDLIDLLEKNESGQRLRARKTNASY